MATTVHLTAVLNAGTSYNSISVSAMPYAAQAGERVFVSLGLTTVEPFVLSAPAVIGDVVLHVNAQVAAHNHAINDLVAPVNALSDVNRTFAPVLTPRFKRI